MEWSPSTIRELLKEICPVAREFGMASLSVTLPGSAHVAITFHAPAPPPLKPLTEREERDIAFRNAKGELSMQYAHTGHIPSDEEVTEYMAVRGDL